MDQITEQVTALRDSLAGELQLLLRRTEQVRAQLQGLDEIFAPDDTPAKAPAKPPAKRMPPQPSQPGVSNADISRQNREKVLEVIAEADQPLRVPDVIEASGLKEGAVRSSLKRLVTDAKIQMHKLGEGQKAPRAYSLKSAEAAPADEDGARTELEKRVLTVLHDSPIGRTANEIASTAGVPNSHISAVLQGLVTRELAIRVDNGGAPTFTDVH